MFSDAWLLLGIVMVLLGTWFGQRGMLTLGWLLLVIVPIAWAWNKLVMRAVRYERRLGAARVFAGETVSLHLDITNKKPLPVPWLRIDDAFPPGLEVIERELAATTGPTALSLDNILSLRWYERVVRQYTLRCPKRGFYFFGPADLTAGDIFGLFETRVRVSTPDRLIVYPAVVPLQELGFPGKEPFGDIKATQRIFEDPMRTVGVRDYQPEDSFRHVHWKASARQQRLQTRVFEPTITQRLAILLNIATYPQPWMGINPDLQDHVISVAASVAFHAYQRRVAVGLVANGSVPRSDQPIRVMPSRDPGALTRVLEALAAVTAFATESIETLLARESSRLPWGATIVVVTAVVTPALLAEMARLHDVGRRLTLVSLDPDFKDDDLPGITVHHLPALALTFGQPKEAVDPDAIFRRPEASSNVTQPPLPENRPLPNPSPTQGGASTPPSLGGKGDGGLGSSGRSDETGVKRSPAGKVRR